MGKRELVRIVRTHLPDVHVNTEMTITQGEGAQQVTFVKRRTGGGRLVWAFPRTDAPKVAHLFGVRLREVPVAPLGPEEIPLIDVAPGALVVTGLEATQRLLQLLGEPSAEPLTKTLSEGEHQVTFATRTLGDRVIWAFNVADAERVLRLIASSARVESGTMSVPRLQPPGSPAADAETSQRPSVPPLEGLQSALEGEPEWDRVQAIFDACFEATTQRFQQNRLIHNLEATVGPSRALQLLNRWLGTYGVSMIREQDGISFQGEPDAIARLPLDTSGEFGSASAGAAQSPSTPPLESHEIAVTASGLRRVFVQTRKKDLHRVIQARLPDVQTTTDMSVTLGEGMRSVTFVKRRRGGADVWAFKAADISRVAEIFDLVIRQEVPELGSDEIAVSTVGLGRMFSGGSQRVFQAARTVLPDVRRTIEDTVTVSREGVEVTFVKRRKKTHGDVVWAFKRAHAPQVAKILGAAPRQDFPKIGRDEIAVASRKLTEVFIGDPQAVAMAVRRHLPNLHHTVESRVTVGEGDVHVTFVKRLSGSKAVWAFQRTDAPQVARLVGVALRPPPQATEPLAPLGPDEVAVSKPSLSRVFVGGGLLSAVRKYLPAPEEVQGDTIVLGEQDAPVTFVKRQTHGQVIWAFKRAEIENVARLMGLRVKQQIPALDASEVAVSAMGLEGAFGVGRTTGLKAIRAHLSLPDPYTYPEPSLTVRQGNVQVTFHKRKAGNLTVWAFSKADASEVAQLLGLQLFRGEQTPMLGTNEVAVTLRGLETVFVGSGYGLLKRAGMYLPEVKTFSEPTVTVRGQDVEITFVKRGVGRGRWVAWAFRSADSPKVAQLLGTNLKADEMASWDIRELQEIGPDEVAVSSASRWLPRMFIGHGTEMRKTLAAHLPDIRTTSQPTVTVGQGAEAVTFLKRRIQHHPTWAFRRLDAPKVARLLGLALQSELPPLREDEVALTPDALARIVRRDPVALRRQIRTLLPTVRTTDEPTITAGTGESQVTFVKRRSGNHPVWAFHRTDAPKLAALMGLRLREPQVPPLGADEIPVVEAASGILVVTGPAVVQRLLQLLGEPPAEPLTKTLGEGDNEVPFSTRKLGEQVVWMFNVADAERVLRLAAPVIERPIAEGSDDLSTGTRGGPAHQARIMDLLEHPYDGQPPALLEAHEKTTRLDPGFFLSTSPGHMAGGQVWKDVTPAQAPLPIVSQAAPWRELLKAQGVDPDQLISSEDFRQLIKLAADLTQPVTVGIHTAFFQNSPAEAQVLTAILQAVAEALNGAPLHEGEHPPQMALRLVLLADEATDAAQAQAMAEALAAGIPGASDHQARLNLQFVSLTLPATLEQGKEQGLGDLIDALNGPTNQPVLMGALIAPTTVAKAVAPMLTARQGHPVATFGFDPKDLHEAATAIPGAQLLIRALRAAAELTVTAQLEARPSEPQDVPLIELPPVLLPPSVREPITSYRESLEATLRLARAVATKA